MSYQFVYSIAKYNMSEFTVQEILVFIFNNFRFAYVYVFPTIKKK